MLLPVIILVIPVVIPLIQQVGIDPVHFGLVVTLNLAIGQQTPPVASVLITACSIARAGIWESDTWPARSELPGMVEMLRAHTQTTAYADEAAMQARLNSALY